MRHPELESEILIPRGSSISQGGANYLLKKNLKHYVLLTSKRTSLKRPRKAGNTKGINPCFYEQKY
jgi:hypothetical protein